MFMSAGLIYTALGRDRITGLGGVGRALPVTVFAFAIGGLALIGVPPSGAYLAKTLLLEAAAETEQWWWTVVIQAGGIFTSSYILLVLAHTLVPAGKPIMLSTPVPRGGELAALALAVCSLFLGVFNWKPYLSVPDGIMSNPFSLKAFSNALSSILGGAVLALMLGRWDGTPLEKTVVTRVSQVRRTALVLGGAVERIDSMLRQWPAAGISLLAMALLLGAAMLVNR